MGTLAAVAILPRIIISPLAGVVIDRISRKKLMIAMDVIRGVAITGVGILALIGNLQIWMVFTAGIILGLCGAFYSPAVIAIIPNIVSKSNVMRANSVLGVIPACTNIIGNSLGGILFSIIGAPLLFLFNGISYLISGLFQLPMKIPQLFKSENKQFLKEMKDGYKYIWSLTGLRNLVISSFLFNFLFSIAVVLFLPFFQRDPALGSGRYGITMALFTTGMLLGMIIASISKFPADKRFLFFIIAQFIVNICFAITAKSGSFIVMLIMVFIAGLFVSVNNLFVNTVIQLTVPDNMRGKVFSFITMSTQAFMPIGLLIGGTLGEFFPIRSIVFMCFMISIFLVIPFIFSRSMKEFLNYEV
jgi:MFS family permease